MLWKELSGSIQAVYVEAMTLLEMNDILGKN